MAVGQGIEDGFADAAAFDEVRLLQDPQLVRYGGLGHTEEHCDVAHADLFLKENLEDADPRPVPEDLEEIRQP